MYTHIYISEILYEQANWVGQNNGLRKNYEAIDIGFT